MFSISHFLRISALLIFGCSCAKAQNKSALLIGVGGKGTLQDLGVIQESLAASGFKVYSVPNPDNETARAAIDEFYSILKKNPGVGLFFFSGKGANVGGGNFLLPSGDDIKNVKDFPSHSVSVQRILNRMQEAKVETKLLFLDCSRSEVMEGAQPLAGIEAEDAFVGYCSLGGTEEGPSVYTTVLAEKITAKGIAVAAMHQDVAVAAKEKLPSLIVDQNSSLTKAFAFSKNKPPKITKANELELKKEAPVSAEFTLLDGTSANHLDLKREAEGGHTEDASIVYFAQLGEQRGLMSVQYLPGDLLKGSFFVPKSGREVRVYGKRQSPKSAIVSLWESDAPLAGGVAELVPPKKNPNMTTWISKMSSGERLAFQRQKVRQISPSKHRYRGTLGSQKITMSLAWAKDGQLSGSYKAGKKGASYQLKGDNLMKGFLCLDEFREGKLHARYLLAQGRDKKGKTLWAGSSYGLDGYRTSVKLTETK